MAFKFEQAGTVNVTNGSLTVTGTGTAWLTDYAGLALNLNGLTYPVASITGPTTLTLAKPYPGETASGLAYTFMPLQAENYALARDVNYLLQNGGVQVGKSAYDLAVESGYVGTEAEWLASLNGVDGQDAKVQMQAVVDLSQFAGQVAGSKGIKLIVPVESGDPGLSLTQEATVIIPTGSTNAGIGIWARATASGLAMTVGLTNVPLPQPETPDGEDIDLSGSATLYAPLDAITALGINLGNATGSLVLSRNFTDAELKIRRKTETATVIPKAAKWITGSSGSPYPVTGAALASSMTLEKRGGGTTGYRNGNVVLNKDTYFKSPSLGIELPSSSDASKTETPPSIRLQFKGVVPADAGRSAIIGRLEAYGGSEFSHVVHWNETSIAMSYWRANGNGGSVQSDDGFKLTGANHLIETEWVDDPTGPGGTVTFYVDGTQYGTSKATEWKPRVTASADFEVNASVENTSNSIDNLEVEYVGFELGAPGVTTAYATIVDGPVSVDDLQNLVVDATGVTTQQPERVISYTANGEDRFDLTVIVGEMVLPAGRAYKAVLEDWSSGAGVPHPNELVMTKPAAQNCRFEDPTLYASQGAWMECLPQGPVPVLDGIRFGCEGIRQGTYVQFQFSYSLDRPSEPFGDPVGLETYMRPHKWMIYDSEGTLLQRIEQPSGQPLNSSSVKAVWEGAYDGRSIPNITDNNRWYPSGTVRSSIIWRNGNPPAYSQDFVHQHVPVYDQRVPFDSHTGFSVNGFDLRLNAGGAGGDGQCNGFANWKIMPINWGEYNYESIKAYAAGTKDTYTNLYNDISATPNAGLWLKYTPFNSMGRSPVVGPGGTRSDRQIMPEVVARYARDVTSKRAHDDTPMQAIALDYLTGYASDPFSAVVGGKITPLFKGNARRNIRQRNHYYGAGEQAIPADQAWYAQVGRLSEWTSSTNPLRAKVPTSGKTANRPYFGGFEIDALHAHQYPGWGSLLFQSPEFAMLQVNFSDQVRMYDNSILGEWAGSFSAREQAWKFLHAALMWKTASTNSTRLYSRAEILDWIIVDFETHYDRCYASTPGFLNPPTNVMQNGSVSGDYSIFAGAAKFGVVTYGDQSGLEASEFQLGYWLSCLHAAHKLGFLTALRAASTKAAALVDWLIAMHRKRIVGRINESLNQNMDGSDYQIKFWTHDEVVAAGGNVASLPGTFTAAMAARGTAPSWDTFSSGGQIYSRDGQAMDALLAGPALLKDMGLTGSDLDAAVTKAEQLFQEKLASEVSRGPALAGSQWFKYHQTTNNRPYKP